MLDNPEVEPNDTQADEVNPADIFYGEPEPSVAPTEEPEKAEIEEETETPDEAAEDGQADEGEEESDEIEVYDEKNDFVKYSQTEDGLYEFKSNKKTVQVNIETLISNFQGLQKQNEEIQKIAEAKKGVFEQAKQEELNALKAETEKLQEQYLKLDTLIKEENDAELEELKNLDPDEYIKRKELKEKREEALNGIREKAQKQQQEQMVEFRKVENQKLVDAMGWSDDDQVKSDISRWQSYLKDVRGYSDEKIALIAEADAWLIIDDAAKFHESKTADITEVKHKPRVVKTKRKSEPKKKEAPKSTAEIFYGSN